MLCAPDLELAVLMVSQVSGQDLAQRAACAGAAALLSLSSLTGSAVASEFDVLAEPTPTKSYFVDDAGVLSRSTKSDLNKRLSILEVCDWCHAVGGLCSICVACQWQIRNVLQQSSAAVLECHEAPRTYFAAAHCPTR